MSRTAILVSWVILLPTSFAVARGGPGHHGRGRHGADDSEHRRDTERFHRLLDRRANIVRTVKEIPGGVETVTESDVPEVVADIRRHVADMERRIKDKRPIHVRDPLFAEIFRHADAITMKLEDTPRGLRVVETSEDPYVAKLIRAHAQAVSAFLANGHAEMRRDHPLPPR